MRRIEARLARLRRAVQDPNEPDKWAMWMSLRYYEPMGHGAVAVVATFSGSEAELSRARTARTALRQAERLVRKRQKVKVVERADVTDRLYRAHSESSATP